MMRNDFEVDSGAVVAHRRIARIYRLHGVQQYAVGGGDRRCIDDTNLSAACAGLPATLINYVTVT